MFSNIVAPHLWGMLSMILLVDLSFPNQSLKRCFNLGKLCTVFLSGCGFSTKSTDFSRNRAETGMLTRSTALLSASTTDSLNIFCDAFLRSACCRCICAQIEGSVSKQNRHIAVVSFAIAISTE